MLNKHKHSFTLVELSLVLFVLAVLVSATLTSSSLMSRAKANRIIKELQEYRQAINTFYNTYGALPGDFADAQYSLAKSGYTTTPFNTITTYSNDLKQEIPINGNQDGSVSADIDYSTLYSEAFGAWSALGQANLITNKYSSFCANTLENCVKIGYNLPSIINGRKEAGYVFYRPVSDAQLPTVDDLWMGVLIQGDLAQPQITDKLNVEKRKHIIAMMGFDNQDTFYTFSVKGSTGAIASNIMNIIDNKIDDGYPLTGSVYGLMAFTNDGHCTNAADNMSLKIYEKQSFGEIQTITDRRKVFYLNKSNQFCIGVMVVDEF